MPILLVVKNSLHALYDTFTSAITRVPSGEPHPHSLGDRVDGDARWLLRCVERCPLPSSIACIARQSGGGSHRMRRSTA
jgi:hypothetical protein